jgi:hypothetical protein
MQGMPPPPEKRITSEGGRFFEFPEVRWSLAHMRELVPTVCIRRGDGPVSTFASSVAEAAAIEALTFNDLDGRPTQWEQAL